MPLNKAMFWKVRAMPRAAMPEGRVPVTSRPSNRIEPVSG